MAEMKEAALRERGLERTRMHLCSRHRSRAVIAGRRRRKMMLLLAMKRKYTREALNVKAVCPIQPHPEREVKVR